MASGIYNIFKSEIMKKSIDLVNDTIKVALLNSSHSFNASSVANSAWSDVSANEITGVGYSAGGATLANKTVTADNTDNEGVFDADNASWPASTISARHAVIYNDSTTPKYLIASIDFLETKNSSNGNFLIEWDAEGIVNLN